MTTPNQPLRMTDDMVQPLKQRYGWDVEITEVRSPLLNNEPSSMRQYALREIPLSLDESEQLMTTPTTTATLEPRTLRRVVKLLLG